jgi:DeoR family transcriptional regulator, fructose operon transcriptional repressor
MADQEEPLLPTERHRRIQELLDERQVVRVSSLSELLGVSEVTVRRDLEALERRGLLERIHGGAVGARRMRSEPRYLEAMTTHPDEKRLIGRAAAALIEPGDTLFMNGGTTTLEVFRQLDAQNVRVVTNHVGIAIASVDRDVDVTMVGGHYRPLSNSLVGPFATENLSRVNASRTFIGAEGVSFRSGITTPSSVEADVAGLMIQRTRGEVVVVADHSKMGTVADFVIAGLDRIDRVVTDAAIDPEYREGLAYAGVDVVIADELVGTRSER